MSRLDAFRKQAKLLVRLPVVFVSNVAATAAFFRDRLGFAIDFLHGHPAFYGAVSRDGATLHLRFTHQPVISAAVREQEQLISAFVEVENVKALFAEYKAKNVGFEGTLKKEAWGGNTFYVRDPDGNWICFAG
jgi:catechol 2,3-dioxygenase-like lactoylglutathione lyase family enzyme